MIDGMYIYICIHTRLALGVAISRVAQEIRRPCFQLGGSSRKGISFALRGPQQAWGIPSRLAGLCNDLRDPKPPCATPDRLAGPPPALQDPHHVRIVCDIAMIFNITRSYWRSSKTVGGPARWFGVPQVTAESRKVRGYRPTREGAP